MLSPHELRAKEFTHAIKGYTTTEVDEHINFIIEKYTELFRANDELEKKLRQTQAELDAYKKDEDAIRGALLSAQRASAQIIEEANERADIIMRASKADCDKILLSFRDEAAKEREKLRGIRREVHLFKEQLFETYQQHIEMIEEVFPDAPDDDAYEADDEETIRSAIEGIKREIASGSSVASDAAARQFDPDVSTLTAAASGSADADEADAQSVPAAAETAADGSADESAEAPAGSEPAEKTEKEETAKEPEDAGTVEDTIRMLNKMLGENRG